MERCDTSSWHFYTISKPLTSVRLKYIFYDLCMPTCIVEGTRDDRSCTPEHSRTVCRVLYARMSSIVVRDHCLETTTFMIMRTTPSCALKDTIWRNLASCLTSMYDWASRALMRSMYVALHNYVSIWCHRVVKNRSIRCLPSTTANSRRSTRRTKPSPFMFGHQ